MQNNQFVLNLNKIVKFTSSKFLINPLQIANNNQAVTVTENIKHLGKHLYCHLTWKSHIYNLVYIKKSLIGLMLRKLLPIVNVKMLHMVDSAHFHSQISYGIIFWGSALSLRNGNRDFPGGKVRPGCAADHSPPLLVPRSWNSRAIPLPTLWAKPGL